MSLRKHEQSISKKENFLRIIFKKLLWLGLTLEYTFNENYVNSKWSNFALEMLVYAFDAPPLFDSADHQACYVGQVKYSLVEWSSSSSIADEFVKKIAQIIKIFKNGLKSFRIYTK